MFLGKKCKKIILKPAVYFETLIRTAGGEKEEKT